jgi:hypothetical protein
MTDLSTTPTPVARPLLSDHNVRRAAVNAQWPHVRDWLVTDGMTEDELEAEHDRIVREIVNALEYGGSGYHICRTLDRVGWSPDDDLVEIMGDVVLVACHDALRVLEEEWVAANDIRPTHAVGDIVSIAKHPGRFDRSRVDGEISEIDLARGRYLVFSSALGHVRKTDAARNHTSCSLGRYVNFEDVLPPAPAPEAAQETAS